MLFGMKNAPVTFQRMVNKLVRDIDGCEGYIDDVVIYSDNWSDHIRQIKPFFARGKTDHQPDEKRVWQSYCEILRPHCRPRASKTLRVRCKKSNIAKFPISTSQKELARFLCMAGYYRKFCFNFSEIAAPLTNLLSKKGKICLDR